MGDMVKIKVLEVIQQGQIGGGELHLLDFEMIRRLTPMVIACHIINIQKPFDMKVQGQIIKLIQQLGCPCYPICSPNIVSVLS